MASNPTIEESPMVEQLARNIGPSKIDMAYDCFGDRNNPPVLLIMGLGGQMIAWHEDFIQLLVDRGLYVVRFDNRDAGLSTHFHESPMPDMPAVLAGDYSTVSYTLSDMAADTVGLMDFLNLDTAHVVGASLGGYIAQTLAIEYPDRIRSLTSMMATTGDMSLGQPDPETMKIFRLQPPTNRNEAMDNAIAALKVIGSPGYATDETDSRELAGKAWDRCYDPVGPARQGAASVASGDRTTRLRSVKLPTLVIHGSDDKMCGVSGGRATADAIPGARLEIVAGMGHNMPRPLWPTLVSLIAEHVLNVEG